MKQFAENFTYVAMVLAQLGSLAIIGFVVVKMARAVREDYHESK